MSRKSSLHVVPREGGWSVKSAGRQQPVSNHRTQRDAIETGRDIAIRQQTELVIHGKNGRIRDSDSFGNDPNPPVDRKR
jgi:hypothetical protein